MPTLDTLRRRISLTEAQLELLRLYSNGEIGVGTQAERTDDLGALLDAGLITADGSVHHLVGDLATAMTHPVLELWVETMSQRGPTVSHVVVRGDEDLWYADPWPGAGDGDEVVFVKDELPQLPWILARLVGFRRSTPPVSARPVTAQLGTVASLLAAFSAESGGTWDDVRTVAIAKVDDIFGTMSPEQREMWIAVLATLEGTWRVTCAWGPEVRHCRGLAAWDCGAGGFWVRTTPAEPLLVEHVTPDAEATFVPTSGGDLWKAFAELLPSKAELAEAADLIGSAAGRLGVGSEVAQLRAAPTWAAETAVDLRARIGLVERIEHGDVTTFQVSAEELRQMAGGSMPVDEQLHTLEAAEEARDKGEAGILDWDGAQNFSDWTEKVEAKALAHFPLLDDQGELIEKGIHAFDEYQDLLEAGGTSAMAVSALGKTQADSPLFRVTSRWGDLGVDALRARGMLQEADWLRRGIAAVDSMYLSGSRTLFAPGTQMPWLKAQAVKYDAVGDTIGDGVEALKDSKLNPGNWFYGR